MQINKLTYGKVESLSTLCINGIPIELGTYFLYYVEDENITYIVTGLNEN